MSRKRILFVDDEANILDGAAEPAAQAAAHWDMVFALGGPAALEELDAGAVRRHRLRHADAGHGRRGAAAEGRSSDYPSVARIVLSGHAEREAVVRALPVAHQFLSKPCDGESLRVVHRAHLHAPDAAQ